ncbi:hypothetical protein SLITO_v1c06030 [Spiroplasma litorale]|uniref:Uncharacterized protein n=1 Tax=Spiroplasma litorale TaxID=216942 RepID=A0A0K1W2A9_9MOLU|nr:TSUP family transporter [Spiroplasma litorale]AKX34237.1 hypothetical protein SLITO_v1c06030 [Spiroplasma litorale]
MDDETKNIDITYQQNVIQEINNIFEISNKYEIFVKTINNIRKKINSDFKSKLINSETRKDSLKVLKATFKNQNTKFKETINNNLINANDKYDDFVKNYNHNKNIYKRMLSIKNMKLIGVIMIPSLMLLALLVSYLAVNKVDLTSKNGIIAFSISMTILAIDLFFFGFLLLFSAKKFVLDTHNKSYVSGGIGFTASFFDTLGVGAFATSAGLLKVTKYIKDDKKLPGTLNVGMAIPNLFSGVLFMTSVKVDLITLLSFVLSAIIGSLIGSSIVNKISKKLIALIMGVVLAITSILMLLTVKGIEVFPSGTKIGVSDVWWELLIGCIAFLFLGIMMSFGVGLYAPAMAVISFLGINFLVVFPIMTCSAGLTMHINAYKFYKKNNYMPKTSFFMSIGGLIGILISYTFVFYFLITLLEVDKNIITDVFKWLSVFVIMYSSYTLLKSYLKQRKITLKQSFINIDKINYVDFSIFLDSFINDNFLNTNNKI